MMVTTRSAASALPQLRRRRIQISAIVFHFLRFGQFELFEIAGDPAVRHVHQEQTRAELLGQISDVRQQALVRATVFECDEDFAVHGLTGDQLANLFGDSQRVCE